MQLHKRIDMHKTYNQLKSPDICGITTFEKHTSMLVYSKFFHSINKLPEFLIPIFANKLTAQEKMRVVSNHSYS